MNGLHFVVEELQEPGAQVQCVRGLGSVRGAQETVDG